MNEGVEDEVCCFATNESCCTMNDGCFAINAGYFAIHDGCSASSEVFFSIGEDCFALASGKGRLIKVLGMQATGGRVDRVSQFMQKPPLSPPLDPW